MEAPLWHYSNFRRRFSACIKKWDILQSTVCFGSIISPEMILLLTQPIRHHLEHSWICVFFFSLLQLPVQQSLMHEMLLVYAIHLTAIESILKIPATWIYIIIIVAWSKQLNKIKLNELEMLYMLSESRAAGNLNNSRTYTNQSLITNLLFLCNKTFSLFLKALDVIPTGLTTKCITIMVNANVSFKPHSNWHLRPHEQYETLTQTISLRISAATVWSKNE